MKINKLFHWLYAFLMGLPLLTSLWIGLIWTFNENAEVPTITENVSREVDFNQLIVNGLPSSINGYSTIDSNIITYEDNYIVVSYGGNNNRYYVIDYFYNDTLENNNIYCIKATYNSSQQVDNVRIRDTNNNEYAYFGNVSNNGTISYLLSNINFNGRFRFIFNFGGTIDNPILYFNNFELFNLTRMFGFGNEPTIQDFNSWFIDDYYDYTLSKRIVIENYSTRQVLDSPTNYIWLPSFGGMGWTIENVFNSMVNGMFGLATSYGIGLTIVKLLTYWLCISLIWLIYDVIMYVPLMIHRWLDKGVIS